MRHLTVKEGPTVFLRDVLVMELLAGVLLYAASFLQNYEMLYKGLPLAEILRYDLFLVVVFSIFQLVYISTLFLNWYFSYFEINPKEIIRKSGLLFRRRKAVDLESVISVETYESPIDRLMHHSSIILHHSRGRTTKIKNVSTAEESVHMIKQLLQESNGRHLPLDLQTLLTSGESASLEFKQTLRFDTRQKQVSKEIERAVLKTLVGFLNTDGGSLIIGVSDEGSPIGLEADYLSLPKKNRDGFENHLIQLVKSGVGPAFAKYLNFHFDKISGQEICLISVSPSHRPAYLKTQGRGEEFFIRSGNATSALSMSETQEYIKTKWK